MPARQSFPWRSLFATIVVALPAAAIAVFLTTWVVSVVHPTYDVVILDLGGITNRELAVAVGGVAIAFGSYAVFLGRRCANEIRAWRSGDRSGGAYG